MPDIIADHPFHVSRVHGKNRLGSIQGPDLALLVHTQDHSVFGRVQIQSDDLADLLDEKGIG